MLDKLKRLLNISDSEHDAFLNEALDYAKSITISKLGQEFETTTVTKVFKGDIYLNNHPIQEINYLRHNGEDYTYEVGKDKVIRLPNIVFEINYSYGYDEIPDDLQTLIIYYASYYILDSYNKIGDKRLGLNSKSLNDARGSSTNNYIRDMGKLTQQIINKYSVYIW